MTDTPNQPGSTTGEGIGTPSLARLLETYTAWNSRNVLVQAARRADAAGDVDRAEALRLLAGDDTSAPSAIDALRAQHELASLLNGWRWQTVAAARELGATWTEIGNATRRDPTEELADYLAAVDQQVRFGYLDDHRVAAEQLSAEDHDVEDVEQWRGRPAPLDPLASVAPVDADPAALAELDDRELLACAERSDATAKDGTPEARDAARGVLDAAAAEAERRAQVKGPDSAAAQVAGYMSLLREDTDHALAVEAAAWRADLDHLLPGGTPTMPASDTERATAELAREVDARMQAAEPPDRPPEQAGDFDLERLDEIATDHGYAVFDPTAPGGVRAPTESERADLDQVLAEPAEPTDWAERADRTEDFVEGAGVGITGFEPDTGTYTDAETMTPAARTEWEVDAVVARTTDPDFPYDPRAEWGEAEYREPRSDDEAAARTAYLDTLPLGPHPRQLTEVEDALTDAAVQADLAVRAHDPDPRLDAQVRRLESLEALRPADQHDLDQTARGEALTAALLARDSERPDGYLDCEIIGPDRPRPWADEQGRLPDARGEQRSDAVGDLGDLRQHIDRMRARLANEHRCAGADADSGERRGRLAHWTADLSDTTQHGDGLADGDAP